MGKVKDARHRLVSAGFLGSSCPRYPYQGRGGVRISLRCLETDIGFLVALLFGRAGHADTHYFFFFNMMDENLGTWDFSAFWLHSLGSWYFIARSVY